MKIVKIALFLILATAVGIGIVFAAEQASVEKGKVMFNDPKLGTVEKSCNSCHADGKGLEKAAAKSDLPDIINTCITKGLKGTAIDVKSAEMQSMVLYIKTFEGKKPAAKKKAAVGC
jgi:cytochrome c peroxidase